MITVSGGVELTERYTSTWRISWSKNGDMSNGCQLLKSRLLVPFALYLHPQHRFLAAALRPRNGNIFFRSIGIPIAGVATRGSGAIAEDASGLAVKFDLAWRSSIMRGFTPNRIIG